MDFTKTGRAAFTFYVDTGNNPEYSGDDCFISTCVHFVCLFCSDKFLIYYCFEIDWGDHLLIISHTF